MSDATASLLPPELISSCRTRQKRLQQTLAQQGVDALLLSNEKDIYYLTGFVGHESLAMVTAAGSPANALIISDSRYDEYLQPWRTAGLAQVVMGTRHRLNESVKSICEGHKLRRLGVQAEHITLAGRDKLAAAVGESRLVSTLGLVSTLRMHKDHFEIACMRTAVDVAQQALGAALNSLVIGISELEFSAALEYQMKIRGSQGASFTPIIGSGPNSSIIHHTTSATRIMPGVLLVDWGAIVSGVCSDLTRTFGIGQMPAKLSEVYRIVLDAQQAAIDAIRPGKTCAEIDAVARQIISRAGYGPQFGHGLGHGLGMDVHEEPYFNNLASDVVLQSGMVMTVEPGVYLPGVGGVRIEDDVLVTEGGADVLSDYPKDAGSAVVEAQQMSHVNGPV